MKPGRELDALVAEKVMGWPHLEKGQTSTIEIPYLPFTTHLHRTTAGHLSIGSNPWRPSTDIAAAWEVVEKVNSLSVIRGITCDLCIHVILGDSYSCTIFEMSSMGYVGQDEIFKEVNQDGDTAPHAICLAALKAVGFEFEKEEND